MLTDSGPTTILSVIASWPGRATHESKVLVEVKRSAVMNATPEAGPTTGAAPLTVPPSLRNSGVRTRPGLFRIPEVASSNELSIWNAVEALFTDRIPRRSITPGGVKISKRSVRGTAIFRWQQRFLLPGDWNHGKARVLTDAATVARSLRGDGFGFFVDDDSW